MAISALRLCLVFWVALYFSGCAAKAADYQNEYALYSAALSAGDRTGAAAHALAAWRAAEETLGAHRVTATLAYNYGQHVLFDDAAAALPALLRARELLRAGTADLPAFDLDAYIAYARLKTGAGPTRDLRAALDARDAAIPEPSYESARLWLDLTAHYLAAERYREAMEGAARAEASLIAAVPADRDGRAMAIMFGGVARLVPHPREIEDIMAAHAEFVRAIALFPPQQDIRRFNRTFAQALAWEHIVYSAIGSVRGKSKALAGAANEQWKTDSDARILFADAPPDDACKFEWENREINFPYRELRKGYLGAVMIGYAVTPAGVVEDAAIMAEVPAEAFGDHVLASVSKWKLRSPAVLDPACLVNRTTFYSFAIKS
jgi:hypothetical protein